MRPEDKYYQLDLEAASLAGLGVVVAMIDPPRILYANAAAAECFGVPGEELVKLAPFDLLAPEQRDLASSRLRRRIAGEPLPPVEVTLVRPDGSRAVVSCRTVDHPIDGHPGVAVFLTTSGTPRADLAADARYRQLVDAAPDGVAITRGQRFLYANEAARAMLGCDQDSLERVSLAELLHPDDLRVMIDRTTAMVRDGVRFPPRDYRLGDNLTEVSSMVIDFEGGPAVLAFVRDVTETRRAQAELERTQRLASLGTLVAGVAHEVNNPLSFASMGAELLQRFFAGGCQDIESGRAALSSVIGGLERITALVRELRAFVRSDHTELIPVDLAEVLSTAVRMTAPMARTRVTMDLSLPRLPMVRGSSSRLEQVFVNLLINAAQSFAGDDVTRNLVKVRASSTDGDVSVTIADNGRGIEPEHLARVFDPFFTTKTGEGIGLGLSIVHAIVAQHQGRVDIASTVGEGTTVTIALCADEQSGVESPDAVESVTTALRRERILVIDDEASIGHMLRRMLAPRCEVTLSTDGREALELLLDPDLQHDVVLCDLMMPEISGLSLFERVRVERPELAAAFAFMTGGFFGEEVLERAAEVPRLEKPFSAAELAGLLERVRRARDAAGSQVE